jgi:hypothetical protein
LAGPVRGSGRPPTGVSEWSTPAVTLFMEKVYITPSPIRLDYITSQPMKRSVLTPALCKTGQITLYNSFEKS